MPLYSRHILPPSTSRPNLLICNHESSRICLAVSLSLSRPIQKGLGPQSPPRMLAGMSVASMPPGVPQNSGQGGLSELFHGGLGDGIFATLTHINCNTNIALEDDDRFKIEVRVHLNLSTLFWDQSWDISLHHLVSFIEHPAVCIALGSIRAML